jgi:hypothetical protein
MVFKKMSIWAELLEMRGYNEGVTPPNTLYSFLLHPIKQKIPSLKRTAIVSCSFFVVEFVYNFHYNMGYITAIAE